MMRHVGKLELRCGGTRRWRLFDPQRQPDKHRTNNGDERGDDGNAAAAQRAIVFVFRSVHRLGVMAKECLELRMVKGNETEFRQIAKSDNPVLG